MAKSVVVVNHPTGKLFTSGDKRFSLLRLRTWINRFLAGGRVTPVVLDVRSVATAASGTLTLATASGTVGGIINGVTITVTASGGDTATATAIAAAINASANALVAGIVDASAVGAVVTVTSEIPGKSGNAITLAATGTNVTASGARLTGGAETAMTLNF